MRYNSIVTRHASSPLTPSGNRRAVGAPASRRVAITARLEYPLPGLPAPGKLLEVADGVYWLRMPLPFVLDHINLWLLRDGSGWVIVDCGFGNDATKRLWEQIFSDYLEGRPVNRIVVTHLHPDHIGLAGWLADRFKVDVWMTQAEFISAHNFWLDADGAYQELQTDLFRRHGLDESKLAEIGSRTDLYRRAVPTLPRTLRRMIGGDTLTIDGREWRVIIGHGHSPEHASLHCDALELMIAGDMMLPKISTNVSVSPYEPDGNPLGLFLDSLRRFAELPADTLVLPSHGHVFYGLYERIEQLLHHHEERFALLIEVCAEPQTASSVLGQLFKRELDMHQLSFAMGEAIAHLNYLMYAKRLERITDSQAVHRFARSAV